MIEKKILQYFFRQAEIGNWYNISIENVEKKFGIKNKTVAKVIPEKKYFFSYYSKLIDKKVLKSISKEDIELSNIEEIIQEFLMNKLDLMNENKFAISNIVNFYITNPKSILINLNSSKKSIETYLETFKISGNIIKKKLITKLLLVVWLSAFRKWLYESKENSISFSIIDKGIKNIKKHTNLFEQIKKHKS